MFIHRFNRLRQLRIAAIGWMGLIVALLFRLWDIIVNLDYVASKWPEGKQMSSEAWLFLGSLSWLLIVAFWPELDKAKHPDVVLSWGWTADQKKAKGLLGLSETEKTILVENRSDEWVYNVQVNSIQLAQELVFDLINEISPNSEHAARARWNGRTSEQVNLVYYFGKEENEKVASEKKYVHRKLHKTGISDLLLRIPMGFVYEANNRTWKYKGTFVYDVGDKSMFLKETHRRI